MSKDIDNNDIDLDSAEFDMFMSDENNPSFMDKMKRDISLSFSEMKEGIANEAPSIVSTSFVGSIVAMIATNSTNITQGLGVAAATTAAVTLVHGACHVINTSLDNIQELVQDKYALELDKKVLSSRDIEGLSMSDAIEIRERMEDKGVVFQDDDKFQAIKEKFEETKQENNNSRSGLAKNIAVDSALKLGRFTR